MSEPATAKRFAPARDIATPGETRPVRLWWLAVLGSSVAGWALLLWGLGELARLVAAAM